MDIFKWRHRLLLSASVVVVASSRHLGRRETTRARAASSRASRASRLRVDRDAPVHPPQPGLPRRVARAPDAVVLPPLRRGPPRVVRTSRVVRPRDRRRGLVQLPPALHGARVRRPHARGFARVRGPGRAPRVRSRRREEDARVGAYRGERLHPPRVDLRLREPLREGHPCALQRAQLDRFNRRDVYVSASYRRVRRVRAADTVRRGRGVARAAAAGASIRGRGDARAGRRRVRRGVRREAVVHEVRSGRVG